MTTPDVKPTHAGDDGHAAATSAPAIDDDDGNDNERGSGGRSDEAQGGADAINAKLRAKLEGLGDARWTWWRLVPKPFLGLVVFCFGFALLSIVAIIIMAVQQSTAGRDDQTTDDDGEASSGLLLCVGVLSSVIGSLQTASGYCAQRLGHQLRALLGRRRPHRDDPVSPSPLLVVGLLLLVCGTIAAILNLGILGQSVTAPFAAMTLIFNGCLAFTVLHEPITTYDIIATVMVLLGVGIAMLGVGMADLETQEFVLADLEAIFRRSAFPGLFSIVVLGSLFLSFLVVSQRKLHSKPAGLCLFSVGAGVLSGFSSLCVKCTVEILKGAAQQHSRDLSNPVTYLFVIGIPVCVLSQLKLMTLGLEFFGTLKFVPPYHAFIILSNLVNGMVYFDESKGYDVTSAILFAVGCTITVGGVFVLLAKVPQMDEEQSDTSSSTDSTEGDDSVLPTLELAVVSHDQTVYEDTI